MGRIGRIDRIVRLGTSRTFFVLCSLFFVLCSLFFVLCSLFFVLCSLFFVLCSLFFVLCSLFVLCCLFCSLIRRIRRIRKSGCPFSMRPTIGTVRGERIFPTG